MLCKLEQCIRYDNAAGRCILLETRRYIYACPINIFRFSNHLLDIQADSKADLSILRFGPFNRCDLTLDLQRTAERIRGTVENCEKPITGIPDDLTPVGDYAGIYRADPNCA